MNLYGFVDDDPINHSDPDGQFSFPELPPMNPAVIAAFVATVWGTTCQHFATDRAIERFPIDDKKKHCYSSCFFNRCMALAPGITFAGGIVHEIRTSKSFRESLRDAAANLYGIVKSYSFQSCEDICNKCPVKNE